MGCLRRKAVGFALAASLLLSVSGCGGHRPPGISSFPAKITINPASGASVQQGGILLFTANAQNSSGGNVNTSFTFTSSDTSTLNVAPGGVACAGVWNQYYTVCTPGGTGAVEVTASADGQSSAPTLVFVHPPIDNITVTGFLLNGIPPQEPCLSQTQTMTVEAHAYSQGNDITSSVGSFTWSANNSTVVKITPIVTPFVFNDFTYNIATNLATLQAVNPGITQIYASATGVSSSSFTQPQYANAQNVMSPALDFFETCNIQSITLQVGPPGIEQTGQTTFVASKGTSENATAVVTDVAGFSSQPSTNGGVVLSKIPLTWSPSQPAVIGAGANCTLTCAITTPSVGSATVTASCSPPTCNIGFPFVPASLTGQSLSQCSQFFAGVFPSNPTFSCEQLIPAPVYSLSPPSPQPPAQQIPQTGAISGLVTGITTSASVLATSGGCQSTPPELCITGIYSFATSKLSAGSVSVMPASANSLLFDLAGDKAYMGSEFGAQLLNPADFGTSNGAYTPLGSVTGQVLAISDNGGVSAFSDTLQIPNQVYIVNATSTSSISAEALNINAAVAAGFTPDGEKTFILSDNGDSLYVYSPLQAPQGPFALAGRASTVAFSPNGAFAFLPEASLNGSTPNLTAYSVCNNSVAVSPASVPAIMDLAANPLFIQVLPDVHIDGSDSSGNPIPDGIHIFLLDSTGFDVITASVTAAAPGTICPQNLTFSPLQRVELGQGTIQPVNFFASADGSLLYVLANNSSRVIVYDFNTGGVTGIPLQNNAIPISAAMTVDDGTILASANDGMLHEISTALGGADLIQLPFPNLPDYLNPFCTYAPNQVPCTLNLIAVKP
ncbi:MAG TPA: hypothetical protein VMD99_03985 [Terriglobales bacterium]|nr:hypothetical protein [Terriglobales bacterium]